MINGDLVQVICGIGISRSDSIKIYPVADSNVPPLLSPTTCGGSDVKRPMYVLKATQNTSIFTSIVFFF